MGLSSISSTLTTVFSDARVMSASRVMVEELKNGVRLEKTGIWAHSFPVDTAELRCSCKGFRLSLSLSRDDSGYQENKGDRQGIPLIQEELFDVRA